MEMPPRPWHKWFPKHARTVLIAGALIAIPFVATYLVFRWLFFALDGIFQPIITDLAGRSLPGVGLVALVLLVYLLGLFATNFIGRRALKGVDYALGRTPLVQYVYRASRQVVEALRQSKDARFSRVVLIDYPRKGLQSIAFVTGNAVDVKGQRRIPLFIPTALNPTGGFLVLVPEDEIVDTALTVEEALRMAISGGLVSPRRIS